MLFFVHLLSILIGLISFILFFIKKKGKNIQVYAQEKLPLYLVLFFILNSLILGLFQINPNVGTWYFLSFVLFLDICSPILLYFYIKHSLNSRLNFTLISLLHIIFPIIFTSYAALDFSKAEKDISSFIKLEQLRSNKAFLRVRRLNMRYLNKREVRFSPDIRRENNRSIIKPRFKPFGKELNRGNHRIFHFTLWFKWTYLFLMIFTIIQSFWIQKSNNTGISKEIIFGIVILITVFGMHLITLTNLLFIRPNISNIIVMIRTNRSFPISLFFMIIFSIHLLSRKTQKTIKYGKNRLCVKTSSELYNKLINYMTTQKPYRDEQLNLNQLAKSLKVNPNDLSQVINKKLDCNFRDFINRFRIEDIKTAFLDTAQLNKNILSIAMENGFNSKSGFNLIFKKHTGMTPTEFIKKNRTDPVQRNKPFYLQST